jgi:hypothetical protein
LTGIVIPIGFVYLSSGALSRGELRATIYSADLLFVLDIFVNFRRAILDGAYPETDPGTIARAYLRGWLVFDLFAAWPVLTVPADGTLYWVVRFLKLLRLPRLPMLFSRLRKHYHNMALPVGEVSLFVFLLSHYLACVWRHVQRLDIQMNEDPNASWWALYIEDIYWVQMTMTTVGYGDIHPEGTLSRVYTIFTMFVASLIFGATISFLTNASKDLFNDEVERRVQEAIRFMKRRDIPETLQRRVQHNLRHRLQKDKQDNQQDLLKLLSPAVQRDLSLGLLNTTVLRFPLFKDAQHSFVAELAQAHSWCSASPAIA